MSQPPEIWNEILLFVHSMGGMTIVECRRVCKMWEMLISSFDMSSYRTIIMRDEVPRCIRYKYMEVWIVNPPRPIHFPSLSGIKRLVLVDVQNMKAVRADVQELFIENCNGVSTIRCTGSVIVDVNIGIPKCVLCGSHSHRTARTEYEFSYVDSKAIYFVCNVIVNQKISCKKVPNEYCTRMFNTYGSIRI